MPTDNGTLTLYRPVGPHELNLIRQSGWKRFPPRLPEQPIFYPVLSENYARQIARDWNVKADGSGFVTKFSVSRKYLKDFDVHIVGGSEHAEYWIPANELDAFNRHIVGDIQVIAEFPPERENWVKVYDLSEDVATVDLIRNASLRTTNFGFVPEVAVFGSDEWWAAINDGRIERHTVEGTISQLPMTGHGDWPEVEIQSGNETTRWTRMGNQGAYGVGKAIRIEYVCQRLKRPLQPEPVKQVLMVWIGSHP